MKIETCLSKNQKRLVAVCIFFIVAILIAIFFNNPNKNPMFPKCFFLEYTGFYCPGCGVTRATYSLLHGDILGAARYNILFVIFIPIILYLFILGLEIKLNNKLIIPIPRFSLSFCLFLVLMIILFTVLRNIHIYPLTLLAPPN